MSVVQSLASTWAIASDFCYQRLRRSVAATEPAGPTAAARSVEPHLSMADSATASEVVLRIWSDSISTLQVSEKDYCSPQPWTQGAYLLR